MFLTSSICVSLWLLRISPLKHLNLNFAEFVYYHVLTLVFKPDIYMYFSFKKDFPITGKSAISPSVDEATTETVRNALLGMLGMVLLCIIDICLPSQR